MSIHCTYFRFSVARHPSMLSLHWTPNSTSYSATGSSSWKNSGPCNLLIGGCSPAGHAEAAGETDWGNLDNDCTSSHAHKCSYLVGNLGNVFKLVGGGTSHRTTVKALKQHPAISKPPRTQQSCSFQDNPAQRRAWRTMIIIEPSMLGWRSFRYQTSAAAIDPYPHWSSTK